MARFRPKIFDTDADGDWRKQEKRVAEKLGGKTQPGSGASMYAKGDVKQDNKENFSLTHFLIECKQTEKKSLSVKGEWLAKITREAMACGKEPALSIQIRGNDDTMCEQDWVAIPMSVFQRLLRIANGEE